MRKRKRVPPEVLRRQYHNKARTLLKTLTSLIPPSSSPPLCRHCNGRECIACCGKHFLLRPDDSPDYRNLLNHCFVVISDNAPPLSSYCPESRWPQDQIVWRIVEMIMYNKQRSRDRNVLCYGYDKYNHSSSIIRLLTSPTWIFLSRRVGDAVMFYLLSWTSVFLPLPCKKYHQVTGFPMSELVFMRRKQELEEAPKKRKNTDICSRSDQPRSDDYIPEASSSCFGCFGCAGGSYSTPDNWPRNIYRMNASLHGGEAIGARANNEWSTIGECPESSAISILNNKKHIKPSRWQRQKKRSSEVKSPNNKENQCERVGETGQRKRSRQCRWKRQQKRRLLSSKEACNLPRFSLSMSEKGDLSRDDMKLQCSCCSVFHTLQKVSGAQIDRQSIFYKFGSAVSVFPPNHILNYLKPNIYDANILFKKIFGLSDANITSQADSCFHSKHNCINGSTCLYHSLLKLLKGLIRKVHLCQHARLLENHCAIRSFGQNCCKNNGSVDAVDPSKTNSFAKVKDGVKLIDESSAENSVCFDANSSEKDSCGTAFHYDPNNSYTSKEQVTSFIWAVCRSVTPPDLLGTPNAQRTLRRNISKLIRLRRFEIFSLKQSMHKLKVSKFPLLSDAHALCYSSKPFKEHREGQTVNLGKGYKTTDDATHILKQRILESWILWFFSCLVVPLVRANFYVTESQHRKQDIFYYQHSVWKKIVNCNVAFQKDRTYVLLKDASVLKIVRNRSFGFSRVRFLPKSTGLRPLANLKAASRIEIYSPPRGVICKDFTSVNGVLRDLHAVLKNIHLNKPEMLGSSVFDYNDVYRKLSSFLSVLKCGSGMMPGLYLVVADVSKAYDSVNQDKLLSVMENFISSENYLLEKYQRVVCTKKSLQVREHIVVGHQDISTRLAQCTYAVAGPSNCVSLNKEWRKYINKEEIFSTLFEHVKQNVLQLNKKFYLQNVGIPQGSILSSLLCSIYYGHMENNKLLPYLGKICESEKDYISETHNDFDAFNTLNRCKDASSTPPRYMVLRFIDDFLFISTSKNLAMGFFSRLQRGFPAYNCNMNDEKFGLNFDVGHNLKQSRYHVHEDGASYVCWSGLLINCCTLEVQADYTRYLKSHMSSTLTVQWDGKPGHNLRQKLFDYLRPKCHPIFYDSNINSASVVRLNIYQSFIICAMKFHCYVANISIICKLEPRSYMEIICSSLRYMNNLIRKRMKATHLDSNMHPVVELKKGEVRWLGLTAYIKVLKRKETRYKELLSLLKNQLQKSKNPEIVSYALKFAIDDSHSSIVWKIKY